MKKIASAPRTWRAFSPVLLAALCLACPSSLSFPIGTNPLVNGLNGQPGRIDLLGRGFLAEGEAQATGFGHYLYLVFLPGASLDDRRSAAAAFLELIEARAYLGAGASRASVAFLAVPVRDPSGVRAEPATVLEILDRYDGARAGIVASRAEAAGKDVPLVAIVAYPTPIEPNSNLDASKVRVADLCGNLSTTRAKIKIIHDELQRGQFDTTRSVTARVLAGFAALGQFITSGRFSACTQ